MEIKHIEPLTIYFKQFETNLAGLWQLVGDTPAGLANKLIKDGHEITGSQHWIYYGADGNSDTIFKLDIAFPIKKGQSAKNVKKIDTFKCATLIHKGAWENFKQSYEKLVSEIFATGHKMTGETRELYHTVDFENPTNNVTEIQIGIK